ncbi:MAG: FAD-dependent monooxygenase [Rhodobacteraceae bacterium]|nr:FAD-dependent monooxygenase [Paracoccaceae bacterium]
MNGAESLVKSLIANGVDICFSNPGTSEMHFVAALDHVPGMRSVLALFEGVATGAADGYYRMSGKPACTLLHLGPGLANGLANLHNAKKAGSGVVNIVGEHAASHLALDAPLTSDIQGIARPMSHWVHSSVSVTDVGADGARSLLRDWANIDTHGWDYHQTAVVCTVTTELSHQYTAWQRFLPEGPLAFLPLAERHQCSIVWSNSTEEATLLCELDDKHFNRALSNAFGHKLGDLVEISERASFPLALRHADHYVETGFALVGDAAHTIHPLAGQGVNIGLLDAATLAEIVIEAHNKGRDIASLHTLKKYQRRRKADNIAMQLTMDVFKHTFGSDLSPVRWLRRFGLKTVNKSVLLRTLFMQQASGYRFANPKLTKANSK